MPKRKTNSEIEHLSKKLKKLERKIIRVSRRRDVSSSPPCSDASPRNRTESDIDAVGGEYTRYYDEYENIVDLCENSDAGAQSGPADAPRPRGASVTTTPPPPRPSPPPGPAAAAAAPLVPGDSTTVTAPASLAAAPPPPVPIIESATAVPLQEQVPEMDPYLVEIFGEDPTSIKEFGSDIHKDLAIRLNHISTTGLPKENRKEIKEKYLIPANCKLIKAPVLNPEIKASLIESQAKRDRGIEGKQTMTACALSSLSAAITLLLSSEYKNPELLKMLMDTARILGDIQHSDSVLRRFFILSTVKKELKDQLEKTKIDETLFGNDLSETLKSAKTINKSGADLRSASTSVRTTAPKSAVRTPANKPLNYRAPPASRRPPPQGGAAGRGARAATAPAPRQATRTTSQGASRTSSRQHNTRYRR